MFSAISLEILSDKNKIKFSTNKTNKIKFNNIGSVSITVIILFISETDILKEKKEGFNPILQ